MEERDKEQVKYHTEILRLSVVGLLTIGGGVVSLVRDRQILAGRMFFIALGIAILAGLAGLLINSIITIKRTIK